MHKKKRLIQISMQLSQISMQLVLFFYVLKPDVQAAACCAIIQLFLFLFLLPVLGAAFLFFMEDSEILG
jgi:hypothetical protein